MPDDQPTASMDRAEKREMARGYRESKWAGLPNYECTREPCWLGTYSRASSLDEAEMQQHQLLQHASS